MDIYAEALNKVVFEDPKKWTASVYSNVTGSRFRKRDFETGNGRAVKLLLWKQLKSPIKWETTVNRLAQKGNSSDYPKYFELGNGDFLTRTFKKINNKAASRCESVKSLANLIK